MSQSHSTDKEFAPFMQPNEELLFYAVPLDDYSEPLILQYDRPQGKQITHGAGWGEADPGVSYDSATAGHAAALQRLVWMPENVLEQCNGY